MHFPDGEAARVEMEFWRSRARAWEAVARNLAQALEGATGAGVLTLSAQMKAHGLVVKEQSL